MRRFILDEKNLHGDSVLIDGEEYGHLNKVLRICAGEQVCLSFGTDFEYIAEIYETYKDHAFAKIISKKECSGNPVKKLTVFLAMLKGDKLDFVVQKLCEEGVSELVIFESRFTNATIDEKKLTHLFAVAKSASKQCGRSRIMDITSVKQFDSILPLVSRFSLAIFAYENEKKLRFEDIREKINDNVCVVIGSEGGFCDEECKKLCELKNVACISLGSRILRAETAGIVLPALCMQKMGEM